MKENTRNRRKTDRRRKRKVIHSRHASESTHEASIEREGCKSEQKRKDAHATWYTTQ